MAGTLTIPKRRRAEPDLELLIDSFAGGGGASLGIKQATGREVDYAINHDEAAIIMHRENHPGTVHLCESVFKAKPAAIVGKGRVGLAWFSPDCTHFSVARGSKPVSPRVRGLAWVVIKWAKLPKHQRPRVIFLENVKEFRTWGPLIKKRDDAGKVMRDAKGRELEIPCPRRKSQTFKRWLTTLTNLGYVVEWRELDAADYGAPTHRRRFFLIARCDGKPIAWPEPTHGDPKKLDKSMFGPKLQPYRTAAQCIDWSLPCPSIFLTKEEARVVGKRLGMASLKRPLAENTMRRIANGLLRYVIRAKEPFIVTCNHAGGDRARSVNDPMNTVCASRDAHGLIVPHLVHIQNYGSEHHGNDVKEPLKTVTAHPDGGGMAVAAASLVPIGYGEREGQEPRTHDVNEPLPTVVGSNKHAQVVAFLAKHFGGQVGADLRQPQPTTTERGTQNQVVAANLVKLRGTCNGADVTDPAPTITGGGTHLAEVRAFLLKYHGNEREGLPVNQPASTVTRKERLGLVTVHGEDYQIVDIGMRMLTPRELARCQGFPDDYILTGTKTNQVARIGNSVCPPVVEALVRANFAEAA
jgi:DNA (cytosine-5)-methyltransferase 1